MITERHEELAALYALGLLEGAERSAFESELAGNPELAVLVASLSGAASDLTFTAPQLTPPPELKQRILAAAAAAAPAAAPSAASAKEGSPVAPFSLLRLVPWGLAAALAVTTTWLSFQNLSLRTENASLQTERRLAEIAYKTASNQLSERSLLAETMINDLGRQLREQQDLTRLKITALASLAGNTPEAQAIAVWDPGRETGLLTVDHLPVIGENQDYQIWVIDPAYPIPVDGGVFKPGADGRAVLAFKGDKPVKGVAAFAISLEKKGGVPKAEGPIVLLGKVPAF
jgi:anti-sigma-K factor RskA